MRSIESCRLVLLVGVLTVSIFSSSVVVMLPAAVSNQRPQSAFATFPGENGKIAFSRFIPDDYEILVMDAYDGSGQTNISNNPATDLYPSWSPNGTKIAFANNTNDGSWEIYVMNADGTNPIRLTNHPFSDQSPSWSPDGTKIAFVSNRDNGNQAIYVMNADDGSDVKRLSTGGQPDWGSAMSTEPATEEDTTAPVLSVPDDITAQATTDNGGTVVTYNVTAEDNVDGTAILR